MTTKELWELNIDDFNAWRRKNDLPKLLSFFEKSLPLFGEWLASNALTADIIIDSNKPGEFFFWEKEVKMYVYEDKGRKECFFIPIENDSHAKQLEKIESKQEYKKIIKFRPYFFWASQQLGKKDIIETKGSGTYDTFRYNYKSAPDVPELCTASIVPGYTVLKLGGIKLDGWAMLHGRNLDFTNLDHLTIDGDWSWSSETRIFYSTIEKLKLVNVEALFTKFYGCEFGKTEVFDTSWYWVEFDNCKIHGVNFENSSLRNVIFKDSTLSRFSFNRIEVENVQYHPNIKDKEDSKTGSYGTIKDNFKRFRTLFQSNGLRKDASEAFYKEKIYELKYNWSALELSKSLEHLRKKNIHYAAEHFKYHFRLAIDTFVDFHLTSFGDLVNGQPEYLRVLHLSLLSLHCCITFQEFLRFPTKPLILCTCQSFYSPPWGLVITALSMKEHSNWFLRAKH